MGVDMVTRIRALCKEKKISLNELEASANLGINTVYKWDNASPASDKLQRVAEYFGVTVDYLLIGDTKKDPSEDITLPMVTDNKRRSLTESEISLFLKVCETHKRGTWAKLLYYTGIRPSECPSLTPECVDLDKLLLNVSRGVESGTTNITAPKTAAGIRSIPIPEVFAAELGELIARKKAGEHLFTNDDGMTMVSISNQTNWWKSIYRMMDITAGAEVDRRSHGVTKHAIAQDLVLDDLRHTYCTNLQKKGIPLNVAKFLMGHTDIKVTANIYTHTSHADLSEAARRINL